MKYFVIFVKELVLAFQCKHLEKLRWTSKGFWSNFVTTRTKQDEPSSSGYNDEGLSIVKAELHNKQLK